MSKDTKILIPEIPGEWTVPTLSGSKCIWNDGWHGKPHRNDLPYVELTARNSRKHYRAILTASPASLARTQKTQLRKPQR